METGVCWLMLNTEGSDRLMPTHLWDGVTDPDLPQLQLVHEGEAFAVRKSTYAMSNSFAFGGSNCSVILGRYG
jgi:3-oxoacyl-[acyl-carrier-protein] synthase-1